MPDRAGESSQGRWRTARLIPSIGSKSDQDREQRATASLLAVMTVVKGFGRSIVSRVGAPAGTISTFTEVTFDRDPKKLRPDGIILVERGKTRWGCLVEVKTSNNPLRTEQFEAYLDLAREHGFDAVLTISNDIASDASEVPVEYDKRKAKGLGLVHLSWQRILTAAIEEAEHRGVEDPEQAYILRELIRYLQDDRSGISGFEGMGQYWAKVRDGAREGTLNYGDEMPRDIVGRWEEFIEYVSLELRQRWGVRVEPNWPRATTRAGRLGPSTKTLVSDGVLAASIKVPNAAAPLDLEADLRARLFRTSAELTAPKEGKAKTRINWLLRQTKGMPDDLFVDVRYPNVRDWVSSRIVPAQEDPDVLLYAPDPRREPRAFRLRRDGKLGRKAGKDQGSFVGESRNQLHGFYRDVLQNLTAWQPRPPKLEKEPEPIKSPEPAPSAPAVAVVDSPDDLASESPVQPRSEDRDEPAW